MMAQMKGNIPVSVYEEEHSQNVNYFDCNIKVQICFAYVS